MERLRAGTSPIVVQEYVVGRDVRVHTVNRCSFATEVISPEIDYRFEHQANTYKATSVPSHSEKLCLQVAEHEDLTYVFSADRYSPNRPRPRRRPRSRLLWTQESR